MNSMDMQASVHNLSQLDRHQNEAHRMPVEHQDQNADKVLQENVAKMRMPVEADKAEGKKTDSKRKKKEFAHKRRKKKKKEKEERRMSGKGGFFVDTDA
ncbi:MAG: hypothetical protein GF344_07090 [Chitinivibrionales bacterium]|nr:hypothetical protein [Chitinivibrionales bacterium]MBD3356677.1 hypothetical protein [Chitinivibrionales bacterium]